VDRIRASRDTAPDVGEADKPFGPVAAAFIAAAFGALVLGALTTLAEVSESVKDFLQFSDAVGPLSGKTVLAVAAWIVAWPILHLALKDRDPSPATVYWITGLILVAGLIGTFPSFFETFASE
jgi:hypothetical protein